MNKTLSNYHYLIKYNRDNDLNNYPLPRHELHFYTAGQTPQAPMQKFWKSIHKQFTSFNK